MLVTINITYSIRLLVLVTLECLVCLLFFCNKHMDLLWFPYDPFPQQKRGVIQVNLLLIKVLNK